MKILIMILSIAFAMSSVDAGAQARKRSQAVKREFQRKTPCPATNLRRGKCPGYQIDHVVPLKCDGIDRPENMQWLTIQDHKEKTRREARLCRYAKTQHLL